MNYHLDSKNIKQRIKILKNFSKTVYMSLLLAWLEMPEIESVEYIFVLHNAFLCIKQNKKQKQNKTPQHKMNTNTVS